MKLRIIKNKKDYKACQEWVAKQAEKEPESDTKDGEKLAVARLLISHFEAQQHTTSKHDAVDIVKARMAEMGLRNKDLVGKIGSKGYVSSILSKKKPLTLEIARVLYHELSLPAEIFLR